MVKKWEYFTIKTKKLSDDRLSELGLKGWELTGSIPLSIEKMIGYKYIFKRGVE